MIALDTETTGLDLRHGAKPYLVTICNEKNENIWWEWHVDPETRDPIIPKADIQEIKDTIRSADVIALQNAKFDVTALRTIMGPKWRWDWSKVRDTLFAGHLLASNQPHNLTTMALLYLNADLQPYEDKIKEVTQKARRIARKHFPHWRIASKGQPDMPSARDNTWKHDMWLPRAIVLDCIRRLDFTLLPEDPQQPTVGRVGNCDVRIVRGTKWGNPFRMQTQTKAARTNVIRRYASYVLDRFLLDDLPELYGKTLGCHCSPELCHGDILRALCHPWWTLCSDYANSDSVATKLLWEEQEQRVQANHLEKIYQVRLKVLPIVDKMEAKGITISAKRLRELQTRFKTESETAGQTCVNIAAGFDYELTLPKSGNNKSLTEFIFGPLALPPLKRSQKTGKPSLDAKVMDDYEVTLPQRSVGLTFIHALRKKRKRDTALSYMEGYERFWLPIGSSDDTNEPELVLARTDWHVLYPSLNPTGTATLRWSSSNPNEQNISKQGDFNLRYCFGPAPGREWWALDANNIELRIPAYAAGETEMIELFERPNDPPYFGSYHLLVFDTLHPEKFAKYGANVKKVFASTWYQWVKNGNFAVQYGAVEQSGTADRAYHVVGGQKIVQGRFQNIKKLNEQMITYAGQHGYVETMPDRTVDPHRGYPLECPQTKWGKVLPTVPLNYYVQGSAMWWMMKAMIRVQAYLDELNARKDSQGYYMVMQVHDELVFDFPQGKKRNLPKIKRIAKLMEQGGDDIGVPTPVSIEYHPKTWSEGVTV